MVGISVIIPVYNSEDSIENSIKSVINQTFDDLEIICVNDGSTDASLDVLNELSNKYDFIKIINQENQGAAIARNVAIENVSGKYIAFLDSDDIFVENDALQLMYDTAIKYDANMVASNIKTFNDDGEFIDLPQYNDDLYYYFKDYVEIAADDYGIPFYFYKNIYKTSFIRKEKILFPKLIRGEDPIFLADILARVDKIYGVPRYLYAFLVSSTGKAFDKLTEYQIKYDYISQYKYCFDLFNQQGMVNTSKRYKRNLFNYFNRITNDKDFQAFDIVTEIFGINSSYFDDFQEEYIYFIAINTVNKLKIEKSENYFKEAKNNFKSLNWENNHRISEDYAKDILKIINSKNYSQYDNSKENRMSIKCFLNKFYQKFL